MRGSWVFMGWGLYGLGPFAEVTRIGRLSGSESAVRLRSIAIWLATFLASDWLRGIGIISFFFMDFDWVSVLVW